MLGPVTVLVQMLAAEPVHKPLPLSGFPFVWSRVTQAHNPRAGQAVSGTAAFAVLLILSDEGTCIPSGP